MPAAIGLSNVTISQLDEARAVAPITTVQNRLSYYLAFLAQLLEGSHAVRQWNGRRAFFCRLLL